MKRCRRFPHIATGFFEAIVHDLRVTGGRKPQPTAAILDGRTLQSTPKPWLLIMSQPFEPARASVSSDHDDLFGLLLDGLPRN